MDLHNGKLFWEEISEDVPLASTKFKTQKHYDVIIIGGGMSGALSGYTLAKEGLKIAIIDQKKMGTGSTLANTGLLQYSNDIKSDHLLFATGYNKSLLFPGVKPEINRSYAIVTQPIKDLSQWKDREMIWETKRPYLYLHTTADGRLIAGGLDEEKPSVPSKSMLRNCKRKLSPFFRCSILKSLIHGELFLENLPMDFLLSEVFQKKNALIVC